MGSDADIAYHELGHAVMFDVAPEVGWGLFDAYGFNSSQGGLHEGYADLVAIWMTDDAEFAEYAGQSDEGIRDAAKTFTCPEDLTGEEHDDGRILPSAFWAARQALPASAQPDLDRASFVVWQTLDASDDIVSTLTKMRSEFAIYQPEHADTVIDVFSTFIPEECETRSVNAFNLRDLQFKGSDVYELEPYGLPHPLQFKIELTSDASEISFFSNLVDVNDEENPPALTMFVKRETPIEWYDTVDETYDNDAEFLMEIELADGEAVGSLGGEFAPGVYYVSISNSGGTATLWESFLDTDGEASGKDDSVQRDVVPTGDDGGCSTTDSGANGILFLLALAFFGRRRRSA